MPLQVGRLVEPAAADVAALGLAVTIDVGLGSPDVKYILSIFNDSVSCYTKVSRDTKDVAALGLKVAIDVSLSGNKVSNILSTLTNKMYHKTQILDLMTQNPPITITSELSYHMTQKNTN